MQKTYVIHSADAIHRDITLAPDVGGLYAFMLKNPDHLAEPLERAGLVMDVMGLGQKPLLYIGASGDSLRGRIRCHLRDDTQNSTFRMSLGALLADQLDLKVKPIPYRGVFGFLRADEARLTAWMCEHLEVGVLPASRPIELERRHIRQHDPVLNIAGRRAYDSAWTVLLLRRRCLDQTLVGSAPAEFTGVAEFQAHGARR
ncbi:GIY-YIG nuclease family protein [Brevundimonas sp. DC300-4]|uniref:GIY-YIG nuclease family protein n=1 Tax=Brevundimonas sp. DC300-4 TaxID=2804594 RepID=UPI003CF1DB97